MHKMCKYLHCSSFYFFRRFEFVWVERIWQRRVSVLLFTISLSLDHLTINETKNVPITEDDLDFYVCKAGNALMLDNKICTKYRKNSVLIVNVITLIHKFIAKRKRHGHSAPIYMWKIANLFVAHKHTSFIYVKIWIITVPK